MLLDFDALYRKYDMDVKGVLHIGAHFGQEYEIYKQYPIDKFVFFEPQPHVYHELEKRIGGFDQVVLENFALGSSAKKVDMYVETANSGMSSSLLKPKLHLEKYPFIQFLDKTRVNQITLDQYFKENINVTASDYNLINIDVQGYELEVFKGAISTLKYIDYIITEVNKEELYENCARVNELDDFLSNFGFERVETKWENQGWGDALYIKKENKKDPLIPAVKHNEMIGIFFSKDRAMQLDATLKSFYMHCKDYRSIDLKVIYTSSDQYYDIQYRQLTTEYKEIDFIKEINFKEDLLSNLKQYHYVLFLVDDNIFTGSFHISDAVTQLERNPDVLGFSLRLGKNNKHYYMMNCSQRLPEFQKLDSAMLKYDWTVAEYDFGFPLEVSSSVYRISDLWPVLSRIDFSNPNTLEFMLAKHKDLYKNTANHLICYERSVTFCNPVNIVNSVHINRAGNRHEYTSRSLADLFNQGLRIDVTSYADFVSNACHQEVDFVFYKTNSESSGMLPETYSYSSSVELEKESNNTVGCGNHIATRQENSENMENTEKILADGERMYKDGQYIEAEKIFRKVIEYNGGCSKAYNNLSCVLWETGRHDEALQALTKSMEITPDNRDAIWNLGRILKFMDQEDDAQQVYNSYLQGHPEDQDLFKALLWWEDKRNHNERIKIPDISVVIPAFNCEKTIIKTLESVKESLKYCSSIIDSLNYEVIIVNDNSSDNTVPLVNGFIKSESNFYLISNSENSGAGPSRNKGVKYSKGDLIFFLDGDDLFLEDHIFQCVRFMIDYPDAHFVKTKIRIDETIHPYWRNAIENSVPINICVKKWCHDFIGGYPEDEAFKVLVCEDVVYNSHLAKYFIGQKIEKQTVHHFRYPGNALDRQMEKFSKAPTPTAFMDALSDAERSVWPEIKMIMNKNQDRIEQSLKSWNKHISMRQ